MTTHQHNPVSLVVVVRRAAAELGPLDLDLVSRIVPVLARGDVHESPPVGHVAAREWSTAARCVSHARRVGISMAEVTRCLREDVNS
jgi:hypothetical protein